MFIEDLLAKVPLPVRRRMFPALVNLFYRLKHAEMRRLYSQFIAPGDLVFDVGANVGHMTGVFLGMGARVVAIEPQPFCCDLLRKRYGMNENFILEQQGVSDEEGKIPFYVCDERTSLSTFSPQFTTGRFSSKSWHTGSEVPVTTLRGLIGKYGLPRFCKIDVEGYEFRVLGGLDRPVEAISFEFTAEFLQDLKLCVGRINELGPAKFTYSLAPRFTLESDWVKASELLELLGKCQRRDLAGDIYVRMFAASDARPLSRSNL